MTFQLCRTNTDKGTRYYVNGKRVTRDAYDEAQDWRYYVNGKRVTRDAYDEAQDWRVCDSFQTLKIKNGYRHLMVAHDTAARHP